MRPYGSKSHSRQRRFNCPNQERAVMISSATELISKWLVIRPPYAAKRTPSFACTSCNKVYMWEKSLRAHQKYECGKEPGIECPIQDCLYKAKKNDGMRQHLTKKHKLRVKNGPFRIWEIKLLQKTEKTT
ncbi:hypothetical protein ILUMI_18880 [Ignelater luminosus]|uniref:C2H2-type domain-containing protein n=1 Tax=Ignelater luminosus TaxID=2038154 RepID=A0A8K0G6F0_IGNLU|nr:hypothetical protein ILUMI_18880 [Ignelater luminosus]